MPTPPIKTKIAIDGEKEYKAALADINSGLKVLNSEMKLTAAQFEENSNSVEALTAKGDVLERQILSQKEKNRNTEARTAELRRSIWRVRQEDKLLESFSEQCGGRACQDGAGTP